MEIVEEESIATANTTSGKPFDNPRHPNHQALGYNRSNLSMMMQMNVSSNGSSSNLSVETHPASSSNQSQSNNNNGNFFASSPLSSELRDSRHDSPKEDETSQEECDDDAMMLSEVPDAPTNHNNSRFILPPPPVHNCLAKSSTLLSRGQTSSAGGLSLGRIITEGSTATTATSGGTSGNAFVREEKVSLTPRFGSAPPQKGGIGSSESNHRQGPQGPDDLDSEHLFSISGSMSSEFLEHQHHNPDHQHDYGTPHERQSEMGMKSPTSTTARDLLREVQCPSLPSTHGNSHGNAQGRTRSASLPFLGTPPLHHYLSDSATASNRQTFQLQPRLPDGPMLSSNHQHYNPPSLSSTSPPTSTFHQKPSHHPTLMREHQQPQALSSSPTSSSQALPGSGSFCDGNGGREKPVISRCFAWSQDSQDERRITKRARLVLPENGNKNAVASSSPLSPDSRGAPHTESSSFSSAPTTLESIVRGAKGTGDRGRQPRYHIDEHKTEHEASRGDRKGNDNRHGHGLERKDKNSVPVGGAGSLSASPSPTRVHWEEKVGNSIELMRRVVPPQVLFGDNTTNSNSEDVAMGDDDSHPATNSSQVPMIHTTSSNGFPPPITAAFSASQYSFESI
ncbi:unnamed protein product [Pseudo-nitzschia multistriata]|uniref:Uncharacterized protein n=1 Tax=Pseudo-nitzschia multistriata TaxID=183589 RepID=A0A448ZDZ2_9STRA|nr:unnamed protein product [Pseudo-nitzschia multistriata]